MELAREFDPSTKRVKQEYYAGTALFSSIETLSLYPQMIKHDFASLILTIGYMRDGLFLPNQMQYQSDEAFVTVQPDKAVGSSQTDEALALLQVKDDLKCFKGLPMSVSKVKYKLNHSNEMIFCCLFPCAQNEVLHGGTLLQAISRLHGITRPKKSLSIKCGKNHKQ